jgi:hypothetical protein
MLSEVGCLCKYLDATRQAVPRLAAPYASLLPTPPLPPRARLRAGIAQDLVLGVGELVGSVCLQGGKLPYQRREVAGCVPGYVLRVLRSYL